MDLKKMNRREKLITGGAVAAAAALLIRAWTFYTDDPWTRDGRIRSDVVALAPDVSGLVTDVLVSDNQEVKKGDILFRVDRDRLQLAVERTEATEKHTKAEMELAHRENVRYKKLSGLESEEALERKETQEEQAQASYHQAVSERALAELNLSRSDVAAPSDGIVTNFSLRKGGYVTAGVPVTAFVSSDAFYIVGYFEENKLPRIHIGDKAIVRVMGEKEKIIGRVESISAGIEDRDRTTASGTLLPNVNPTFNWVRLPQRIPVRVALVTVPPSIKLVSGRTATVSIEPDSKIISGQGGMP